MVKKIDQFYKLKLLITKVVTVVVFVLVICSSTKVFASNNVIQSKASSVLNSYSSYILKVISYPGIYIYDLLSKDNTTSISQTENKPEIKNSKTKTTANPGVNKTPIVNTVSETNTGVSLIQKTSNNNKTITSSVGRAGPVGPAGPQGPKGDKGEPGQSIVADTSNFVSSLSFSRQLDGIFKSITNSVNNLSDSLGEKINTKLLTVSGNATVGGDLTVSGNLHANVTGNITTANSLASNPTDCPLGTWATMIDASGNLTCSSITPTDLGLVIGTNVLAQRTFGTAANNATTDFVAARTFGTAANNNTGDFEVPLTFSTGLNRTGNTITSIITQYTNAMADARVAAGITGKQNTITTGTTSQYFKGDLSLGTFPTALSSFTNDLGNYGGFVTGTPWTSMGYLTSFTETDPTIYAWAKASTKPAYTASDVGLGNVTNESKATMFTNPVFTGTVGFGDIAMSGNIIPTVNNTYTLGDATHMWKDFYVGPGSIYVDGQKVLQTNLDKSVVITSDINQNLIMQTSGTANIEFNPSGTGSILLKSNVTLSGGKVIRTSDLSPLIFSDGISVPKITTAALNGGLEIAPNGTGNTYITTNNFGIRNTAPLELLSIGTSGTIGGTLSLAGLTSGKAIIKTSDIAGTPTLTLPTTTGTLALTSDIPSLSGYVPYTGGTSNVDLGVHNLTVDTNSLFVDSVNHRVGIGTTSPVYNLHVSNSSVNTSVIAAGFLQPGNGMTNITTSILVGQSAVNNGSAVFGYRNAATGSEGAYISLYGDTTPSLFIKNGGNVGIGTTNPLTTLHVNKDNTEGTPTIASVISAVFQRANTSASQNDVAILAGSAGLARLTFGDKDSASPGSIAYNNSTNSLSFSTAATSRLSIDNAGNVGIGTTTPGEKLEVNGNVKIGTGAVGTTAKFTVRENSLINTIIGSATDDYGKLDWTANAGGAFIVSATAGKTLSLGANNHTGTTADLFINTSGNVGIGTTSPAVALDVVAATGNGVGLRITNVTTDATEKAAKIVGMNYTNANRDVMLLFSDSYSGQNDVNFGGGSSFQNAATQLKFFTAANTNTATGTEAMRISSTGGLSLGNSYVGTNPGAGNMIISGNVGIGTTSPRAPLDVLSTAGAQMRLTYTDNTVYSGFTTDSSGNLKITSSSGLVSINASPETPLTVRGVNVSGITSTLYDSTAMAQGVGGAIAFGGDDGINPLRWFANMKGGKENGTSGDYAGYLSYLTRVNGGSLTEKMRITSTGNLGIGTTSPNQQLEITKNFRLPSTTYNGGNPYGVIYKDGNRFIHDFNYGDNGTVTTNGHNLFMGANAGNFTMGSTATSGNDASYNVALGDYILNNNTTGNLNSGIGYYSLNANTIGHDNIGIGGYSLLSNTTGYNNVGIGSHSLRLNTVGYQNFGVGVGALYNNVDGHDNFGFGYNAGKYITDGSTANTTGDYNIFLGNYIKALADNDQNEIVIGYNATGNGSNTTTIGTRNVLYVGGASITGKVARFTNSTGYCDIDPTTTSLTCSSDINLKKNITTLENIEFALRTIPDISNESTLEKLSYLTPVVYNWKTESNTSIKHIGFIAQEMEQIFPDLVATDANTGLKSVSYTNITPYLVKAIQEMNLKVVDLSSLDTSVSTSLGYLMKEFLGSVGNNISDLYALVIHTDRVETKTLCVGSTCVTEEQFLEMVNKLSDSGSGSSSPTTTTTDSTSTEATVTTSEATADTTTSSTDGASTPTSTTTSSTDPDPSASSSASSDTSVTTTTTSEAGDTSSSTPSDTSSDSSSNTSPSTYSDSSSDNSTPAS